MWVERFLQTLPARRCGINLRNVLKLVFFHKCPILSNNLWLSDCSHRTDRFNQDMRNVLVRAGMNTHFAYLRMCHNISDDFSFYLFCYTLVITNNTRWYYWCLPVLPSRVATRPSMKSKQGNPKSPLQRLLKDYASKVSGHNLGRYSIKKTTEIKGLVVRVSPHAPKISANNVDEEFHV